MRRLTIRQFILTQSYRGSSPPVSVYASSRSPETLIRSQEEQEQHRRKFAHPGIQRNIQPRPTAAPGGGPERQRAAVRRSGGGCARGNRSSDANRMVRTLDGSGCDQGNLG
ncbi:hypothetical protein GCM10010435_47690 [Winogradskya consettensis]|uniref:Uncharacterized protein n=1 Tax=Winogradskya consettensis TaxID=113560 RepID=A0A919SI93_9ACTN|nr:hypothetical protein Aco04nite_32620 [Actinoplanes consettensis]